MNLATEGIVAPEMLLKQYGGEMEVSLSLNHTETQFEYEAELYFSDMVKKCIEIRAANAERWRALGGKIGLSEWDFRMPMSS